MTDRATPSHALLLPLLLAACAAPSARPSNPPPRPALAFDYEVVYREDPARLEVEARWRGAAPRWGFFEQRTPVREVVAAWAGGRVQTLVVDDEGRVALPADLAAGGGALRWVYPLEEAARGGRLSTGAGREGAYVLQGEAYLLVPLGVRGDAPARLRYAGADPLLPWAPAADGRYAVRVADVRDPGFHAFGGRRRQVEVSGLTLDVAILEGPLAVSDEVLLAWVEQGAREMMSLRGAPPAPRVPVVLAPVPRSHESSPFGMARWSDPPSVAMYVGGGASARAFERDWVAVHELLHLAQPRFSPRVTWLSEGLATYYQEVLRARSGRLSEAAAWSHVVEGAQAGRRQARGRSLADLSAGMHETYAYRAVYWGGALLALDLDRSLRAASAGRASLDDVLRRLNARPVASLEDFGAAVDALAGRPLYAEVAARHLEGPALDAQGALFFDLGIEPARGRARLLDDAPQAALRRAIVTPGPDTPSSGF